jgi:hypothetical protein
MSELELACKSTSFNSTKSSSLPESVHLLLGALPSALEHLDLELKTMTLQKRCFNSHLDAEGLRPLVIIIKAGNMSRDPSHLAKCPDKDLVQK